MGKISSHSTPLRIVYIDPARAACKYAWRSPAYATGFAGILQIGVFFFFLETLGVAHLALAFLANSLRWSGRGSRSAALVRRRIGLVLETHSGCPRARLGAGAVYGYLPAVDAKERSSPDWRS